MVAQRRFLPLVTLLGVGLLVICVRLFQVQVVEASVWGREAANLVRSSNVVPYHRGQIVDRNARPIARDEDLYQIVFTYRDFRRGHPLAQIAHARSLLELRAVPLPEALAHEDEWARALVTISPAQLSAFARGDEVELGGLHAPAVADPEREQRPRRAADLRWYLGELLDLTSEEWRALRLDPGDALRERPYVELVATRARATTPERLQEELAQKLANSRAALDALAPLFQGELPGAASSTTAQLVLALEAQRHASEDASADRLFECAAGFAPGRISSASLAGAFDLGWIAALLHWDAARLGEWERSRRGRYEGRLTGVIVPRLLARAAVEEEQGRKQACARLLDGLAQLYAPRGAHPNRRGDPPASWTELGELAVLDELEGAFEGRRLPREFADATAVLPLNDPELQATVGSEQDPWILLGLASQLAGAHELDPETPPGAAQVAERWNELARKGLQPEDPATVQALTSLVRALEARFLAASDRALVALRTRSGSEGQPLVFARARLDAAMQQERSIQKDEQSRPVLLREDPPYELVHLIERHPGEFAGFEVRPATRRRMLALDEHGLPLARALIGRVRKPSLSELFAQIRDERRYDALKYQALRSRAEDGELTELASRLFRADEWTGGAGLEEYFDPELRGRFGWRELQGLAGRKTLAIGEPPVDGQDLELTLDLEIQKAAQAVLEHPDLPVDPSTDPVWFRHPVGAIVLMTTDGEVLAAASVPSVPGEAAPGRDRQRELVYERTLQMPTFNPPGSVFKPFVAAYALDKIHYDPTRTYTCAPIQPGDKVGGYADMHCAGMHGDCDLRRALQVSCNAYFAHLGECYTTEELSEMAHIFGFGERTGVRCFGSEGRSGLVEHARMNWTPAVLKALDTPSGKRKFANGLTYVQANPMQVARAMAGIATGWLPEVTLARSLGGRPIEKRGRALGISEESLAFVRHAMELVVHAEHGSAYNKGLDEAALGFRLAAKTGSGDYAAFKTGEEATDSDRADAEEKRVRKHTWVAGFFPADHPRAVIVVYLHDTSRTASHTAVYVTAQFLRQPAVRNWLTSTLEAERATQAAAGGAR